MKFTLVSLKSGWLNAQIEHIEMCINIKASNLMGGDFVEDVMTALYESMTEKAARMVVYSNENSDFGLLIEPQPDGYYTLMRIYVDDWGEDVFLDPDKAYEDREATAPMFTVCGVYRNEIIKNRSIITETVGPVTEMQLYEFAISLLSEFECFKLEKGKTYYEDNWICGSDNLTDKKITSFPYETYNRLFKLVQKSFNQPGEKLLLLNRINQKRWRKTINEYWNKCYKNRVDFEPQTMLPDTQDNSELVKLPDAGDILIEDLNYRETLE